jgi:radical SAM superfamily enzyme YgiQ (UPF0313 family)
MAPVVALVGAEFEENLSLRYLAATVERAGFRAEIVPFNDDARRPEVAARVLALEPLVVGLSVPFQVRARQLLAVAQDLRAGGYAGHVCIGGHFATFEYANLLRDYPAIDSVVRHEGEDVFRELCESLRDGRPPGPLAGLALRGPSGPVLGPDRLLPPLDQLAHPDLAASRTTSWACRRRPSWAAAAAMRTARSAASSRTPRTRRGRATGAARWPTSSRR